MGGKRTFGDPRRGGSTPWQIGLTLAALGAALLCAPVTAKPRTPPSAPTNPGTSTDATVGTNSTTTVTAAATPATLVITRVSDMQFGQLTIVGNSGTVTMPTSGLPAYTNVVKVGGTQSAARFTITGEKNMDVTLTLSFPMTGTFGAAGQSKLDALILVPDNTNGHFQQLSPTTYIVRLNGTGTNAFTIGGKLSLVSNSSGGHTTIPIPVAGNY